MANGYTGMQRIIFVGMHNKPGMRPLDVKTKTGRLVERIAEQVRAKNTEVLKTNLCEIDTFPQSHVIPALAFNWIERVGLYKGDIVVLLGAFVHKHFPKIEMKKVKIGHPSSVWSHEAMDEYVNRAVKLINEQLQIP